MYTTLSGMVVAYLLHKDSSAPEISRSELNKDFGELFRGRLASAKAVLWSISARGFLEYVQPSSYVVKNIPREGSFGDKYKKMIGSDYTESKGNVVKFRVPVEMEYLFLKPDVPQLYEDLITYLADSFRLFFRTERRRRRIRCRLRV